MKFEDLVARATRHEMTVMELLGAVETIPTLSQRISLYITWANSNGNDPLAYIVYFNLAVIQFNAGNMLGAREAHEGAIRNNPEFLPPYLNLGLVYERLGRVDEAIALWTKVVDKLSQVVPQNVDYKGIALKHLGRVREARTELAAAEAILQQGAELQNTQRDVIQHWVVMRQRQGKWPVLTALHNLSPETILKGLAPLSVGTYCDDAILQLANAVAFSRQDVGWPKSNFTAGPWAAPEQPRSGRLKIGYLSSDLRHHAIGFLMSEVFGLHDRSKVEVFVYYCGPNITDVYMERIKGDVDHWVHLTDMSDEQAARQMLGDGIDILVDINGNTNFARTKLLSLRPAPVIANWLGYPGTMGSPYHDYIIADDYIIPKEYELFYTERVARLPCYQSNDRQRVVSPTTPSRTELGLPAKGVVFCCFNGMQKITAPVFQRWLTILQGVPGSVLWLLNNAPEINERLQQAAAAGGVAPERLVFAGWATNPDHVARYRRADVVLDTWPYGAHTTASDALWMGVPIITLSGRGFASRVCGSLARAAGTPELVCRKPEEYVRLAIQLGNNPAVLERYKTFLQKNRDTCTLFDTPNLVRRLEDLYATMWHEYETGTLPRPDMANLDVYHEVGVDLSQTGVDALDDAEYFAAYRRGIAYRHSFSPIPPDNRLWTKNLEL